jgi:hypothetical protein
MKTIFAVIFVVTLAATQAYGAESGWYTGDERCPDPKDDGSYSAPYNAIDHEHDFPTFYGADKHGWSCSYQRADGVIIQYGDSRTPQEQWLALWGGGGDSNDN